MPPEYLRAPRVSLSLPRGNRVYNGGSTRRRGHQECVVHDCPFFRRQISADSRRVGRTFCDHVSTVVSMRPGRIPPGTGLVWPDGTCSIRLRQWKKRQIVTAVPALPVEICQRLQTRSPAASIASRGAAGLVAEEWSASNRNLVWLILEFTGPNNLESAIPACGGFTVLIALFMSRTRRAP